MSSRLSPWLTRSERLHFAQRRAGIDRHRRDRRAFEKRLDASRRDQRRRGVGDDDVPRRSTLALRARRARSRSFAPCRRRAVLRWPPCAPRNRRARSCAFPRSPSRISNTSVGPVVVISSKPSDPCTTNPRFNPSAASAPANNSAALSDGAPTSCAVAPAGFVSGPSRLNAVRIRSSARTGAACFIAVCTAGANRKPMPTSRMARAVSSGDAGNRDAKRIEQVHAAASLGAGYGAVAVFGNAHPRARRHERRYGRDIECLRAIPARAAGVEERLAIPTPISTRTAIRRMARAKPTNSSTVSPFTRSAIRNPAICAGATRPSRICCMAVSASAADRFSRAASLSR